MNHKLMKPSQKSVGTLFVDIGQVSCLFCQIEFDEWFDRFVDLSLHLR